MGKKKSLVSKIGQGIKKAVESKTGKSLLKRGARFVKGAVKKFITGTCPECGAALNFATNLPVVKKGLASAQKTIKKKCPTCGEVLDIAIKA